MTYLRLIRNSRGSKEDAYNAILEDLNHLISLERASINKGFSSDKGKH